MAKKTPRPSEVFADRLREIREVRRWTQQDLVDRLERMGEGYDRATIARMEIRKRTISLDEALMLSAALGVSPLHMFVPLASDDIVRLAGRTNVTAHDLRVWVQGYTPLDEEDRRTWLAAHSDAEIAVISTINSVIYLQERAADLQDAILALEKEAAEDTLDDLQELTVQIRTELRRSKRLTREEG
jgi:transcriptional regulator with XRE-family HTH domain